MGIRKAVEIGIRIYGIYLLVQIPLSLWGIVFSFGANLEQFARNPRLYIIWSVVAPFLYLGIAIILILKAESISKIVTRETSEPSKDQQVELSHYQLSFWITLLGINLLVTYVSKMLGNIMRTPLTIPDFFTASIVLPQGIVIGISLYMIFRSKNVERYINKKSANNGMNSDRK